MRLQLHLLIYIGAIEFGCFNKYVSSQCLPGQTEGTECSGSNSTHNGRDTAGMCNNSASEFTCLHSTTSTVRNFLQCVGLPDNMSKKSIDHMRNLKGIIDTALDVYSFMRSSFSEGPILELSGMSDVNTEAEQFHDLDFIKLWFQVKLKPLLSTVTRQFLSCLSTKNFSCEAYQTVVKELSLHFSSMDPARKRWIYMFFMYPFLARNGSAGCVSHLENSEDWLMKNFGSFSAMAHFKDFTALNIVFSGLEVLHLLTPEQKAELLLHPEVGGLDNGAIHLVFKSLVNPLQENQHMNLSKPFHKMTTSAPIPLGATLGSSYHMPYQHDDLQMAFNGGLMFLKPLGSFVKEFVSLTHKKNLASLKSTTLAQAMINWTLAELAGHFTPNTTLENEIKPIQSSSLGNFDITDIDDWFQQVVVPVLNQFLPGNQTEIPKDLAAVFYSLFSLNSNLNVGESDAPDVCSVTLQEQSCSIPNAVQDLAYVLRCAGRTNLTINEENMRVLVFELSQIFNSLIKQYSAMNFSSTESDFMDLFEQHQPMSFTDENLHDVEYIRLWFQIKLKPFLPSVSKDFLLCLSSKNFSCETFQILVMELSEHIKLMDEMKQQLIYSHFIHPFLLRHKYTDSSCIPSTSSLDWVIGNIGKFSIFAPLQHFFDLHSNFSALEALPALSAKQMAELVAFPESESSQNNVIINTVFDHLLESPKERNLEKFLHYLLLFSTEALISCESYKIILGRLDRALPSVPWEHEAVIQASMNELAQSAPEDCILGNFGCPMTPYNETTVCAGVNSTELQHYLDYENITKMLCHFSIGQYACSSLVKLRAENLVTLLKCKLPSNTTCSKETWKMFLTKVSGVLDEALSIFSNMSFRTASLSTSHFLDILGELRIGEFSDEQLEDVDLINTWFSENLRPFLSSVSGEFLRCLGSKNFSCESYQQMVKAFSFQFPHMKQMRQELVARYFILPFLSRNTSDPVCMTNTNGSLDWLLQNFGPFSVFLPLEDLQTFNANFDPLEALPALSAKQMAELVAFPESESSQQNAIINTVFDHLLESPKERNLKEFLHFLILFSTEKSNSCDSYNIILRRLDLALPSVSWEFEAVIRASMNELMQRAPEDCIVQDSGCPVTLYNETRVCARVNSTELQHHLDHENITKMLCHFSIGQYACSSLVKLRAENLVTLLKCKLPSNTTYSKETWKMFLTKVSGVLDEALSIFSNMSFRTASLSTSHFLDILGELRIDEFSDVQLADVDFINKWFSGNLRPFLSSVSGEFLRCLGSKNFSCESYQQVVKEFSFQFPQMDRMRQELVYQYFILPMLSRNTSDPACVSGTNGSVDWLHKNIGPFSVFVALETVLLLNQDFAPLEALPLLSAKQMAELILFLQTGPPQKVVIINTVFDHLGELPDKRTFKEFLHYLILFSRETMINCNSYRTLFSRLYQALPLVPQELEPDIWASINELIKTAPGDCMPDVPGCSLIPHNETRVCADVNSSELQHYLDTGNKAEELCHFDIKQYACSSLIHFTAENLVSLLKCKLPSNMTYSKETWKVFLTKASGVLNEALDIFSNMTFHTTSPSTSHFLEILGEIRIDRFNEVQLADVDFISKWFHGYLSPFLSSVSGEFLHCLSTKNFSCETYQQVVKELSFQFPNMNRMRQELVSKYFILPFLSHNTSDPACISSTNGSVDWLHKNFGLFSVLVPLETLLILNQDFDPMDALPRLSINQLSEVASTPGRLNNPGDVNALMGHVKAIDLATFFDIVSPAIQDHENEFPSSIRSAMLQQVFDRGSLSESSVSDAEVLVWLKNRLSPLLANLPLGHVAPFFNIVKERQCITSQQAVKLLNSIHSTLHNDTQREVYAHILTSLKDPVPLRCYTNGSFYSFMERSFLSFQFPNLTTFISLMPESQRSKLINSIPPSDLRDFFMRPKAVDNNERLCIIFNNYDSTPDFLDTPGDIPDYVRRSILPCVWPLALSSENETEVELWFETRLKLYLTFLTKDLIQSTETLKAKCLPFRKFVSVLGDNYKYNNTDFTKDDVYDTIKTYLSTGTKPKCYNASHPQLNSKAWFANYIGEFITYMTLDDLNTFGSTEELQVFSTNLNNVELFNHSSIPGNVSSYYTELIYLEDSNFNPLLLPINFRCTAPGSAYSQLSSSQSMIILQNLTQSCNELDPEVSAALAGNFETVNLNVIEALGKESVGLTTAQITAVPPYDIVSSLTTLSTVTGWNQGQSMAIVKMLLKANFGIVNSSQLQQLGSLVMGVSSKIITNINSTEILLSSHNPSFISNILTAPQIIQHTYISKIISVSSMPEKLLENVPDIMAKEVPRVLLEFSSESFEKVNMKKWKHDQAVLFFDMVAAGFNDSNNISTSMLQGFTCTRVQKFSIKKITDLIKACKRKGVNKVVLRETQLTCMYNHIKDFDSDSFQEYPPELLLYYNYNTVRRRCKAYFMETGAADFSVLSDALKEKKSTLLDNAKSCLGITGTSINRTNVEILGNMCCILDGSHIENSDSLILEKLKNCKDLSEVQITSVEKVLMTGNTSYGHPSTWNLKTLNDLAILPLYMKTKFWNQFTKRVKRKFLKKFMKKLRRNRTEKRKMRELFKECNRSLRSKRAAVSNCPGRIITQVVISDDAFPFGYDASQFDACLSATTVKNNLAALAIKVDDDDYQRIVLEKLYQAFPTGIVGDDTLQLLGTISRVASINDIKNWNITTIDTLDALMVIEHGRWDPDKSKAIITQYLRTAGNSLGSTELSVIGGENLCSLDTSVLKTIAPDNLRNANSLHLSNCLTEKEKVLFTVARQAFSNQTTISLTEYQLMQNFLGGASEEYIKRLTASNVNMDIETFIHLDETVIDALTVNDVRMLLGANLPDLKTFENQTVVANWIEKQLKSELNSLGLDIIGGREDPTPTGIGVINTTATGGSTTTTTITTTSGHGGSSTKSSHVQQLLLALAFTTLQILL